MAKNLPKKNNGRPTKYEESFCDKMLEFFDIPHTVFEELTKYDKEGKEHIVKIEKPNVLPTFEKFAVNIGVHRDTLNEWTKQFEEFSDSYKKCKDLQRDMLNDLAMRGFYNPTYTIFVAKNIADMKDKVETETNYIPPNIRVNGVNI